MGINKRIVKIILFIKCLSHGKMGGMFQFNRLILYEFSQLKNKNFKNVLKEQAGLNYGVKN